MLSLQAMSRRREKQKPQKATLNKQLADEQVSTKNLMNKEARLRTFKYELGKFLVDIAKLVFAGVIVAGIMDEDINRGTLFFIGSCVVLVFALTGLLTISNNKED